MKNWKRFLIFLFVLCFSPVQLVQADEKQALDSAVDQATQQIAKKFKTTSFNNVKNIAILPLWGMDEDGYVVDTLKSHLSDGPYALMVRSTPEWDQLLGEIKWNTLREDIMNTQTVQTFGKIEGCDAILYGTVRERGVNPNTFKAIVRMTMHMADVETGQILWSSQPVIASTWLEWPEMLTLAIRNPFIWAAAGIIVLLIIWRAFKKLVKSAATPR